MKSLLIPTLLLLLTCPAWGEVIINVETKHYGVIGKTKRDIMRNMQRRAPFKEGKSFVPAYTGTDMKYQYTLVQRGNRCSVEKVKVYLNLLYMYPKLAQYQAADIRWWWRDIIKAYTIHEEIHGDISIRWAHELDRELRSLKNIDCSSSKEIVKAKAKRIFEQMHDEQEAYDKITQHGLNQYKYKGPEQ